VKHTSAFYLFYVACLVAFVSCTSSSYLIPKNTELCFPLSSKLKEILYYASLAPSGHNTQSWKVGVRADEKTIRVYLDSSRLLHVVDALGRESLISVGTFIKNLSVALEAFGYSYSIQLEEAIDIHQHPLVATIHIEGNTGLPLNAALLAEMEKRHTEKRKFLPKPLDAAAVLAVLNATENQTLFFPKGSKEFEFIKIQSIIANELQSASPAAREELAQWLRFSNAQAKAKADGLPAEQLGLRGIVKAAYYATMSREKAAKEAFGKTSLNEAQKQLNSSMGFFIVGGGTSNKSHVETGFLLETLWLAAVRHGISIQPISQALEEKETLERINAQFPEIQVQMILRCGYVKKYGENARIRRPLQEFVFLEPIPLTNLNNFE